jgi:hypothetical protein
MGGTAEEIVEGHIHSHVEKAILGSQFFRRRSYGGHGILAGV